MLWFIEVVSQYDFNLLNETVEVDVRDLVLSMGGLHWCLVSRLYDDVIFDSSIHCDYVPTLLSVAHHHPTGVLISQGAGGAAHHCRADVSGLCFS